MIAKIVIENFRSIEKLEIEPQNLCALVGPNSAGKTNVLKALDVLLGESYPTERAFSKDDFYGRDPSKTISIQVWFAQPLQPRRLTLRNVSRKQVCSAVSIRLMHTGNEDVTFGTSLVAADSEGTEYWASGAVRDQISFVYIPSARELEKHMSVSQWSLLGKILRKVDESFRKKDPGDEFSEQEKQFREAMKRPREILESEFSDDLTYQRFKECFVRICRENTQGLTSNFDLDLEIYDPLFYYKTIQIIGTEDIGQFNVHELGSGVQNLVLLSLFRAYAELLKEKAILAIEEPEIYLYPQAQRQLYKTFRSLAYPPNGSDGSQIFYTTHSPNFVDAQHYAEIVLVRKNGSTTKLPRSGNLAETEREEIKVLTEFTPERNEMFFASKIILVEGETEKHALPYLMDTLGYRCEKENISIIAANGKTKLKFLIRVCQLCNLEWVAYYDTDTDIKEKIAALEKASPSDEEALRKLKEQDRQNDSLNAELDALDQRRVIALKHNIQDVLGLPSHKDNKWKEIKEAREHCQWLSKEDIPRKIQQAIDILYPA